ncbi:MAG: DNA-directed RNA polymerase subunit omega [Candidatus Omnitrophica bacterium]|nr:DNA-directed RNA polymerase subunit omega [Candidatus Omnitrophota bacterium]
MIEDYIPRERLLGATNGSIYKLAVLAAKRAMILAEGEKPLVEKHTEKLLDLSLAEIEGKKIGEAKGKKKKTKKDEKEVKAEKKEASEEQEEETKKDN